MTNTEKGLLGGILVTGAVAVGALVKANQCESTILSTKTVVDCLDEEVQGKMDKPEKSDETPDADHPASTAAEESTDEE